MRHIRKYNNNIILAEDKGRHVIVLGKGIGFQALQGAEVDMSLVEKVFIPQETAHINRFADILSDLAYEYLILASKIVNYGKEILQAKLNPSILVALADHFSVSLTLSYNDSAALSPLQLDVRHIYPKEFEIGIKALEIIKNERNIMMGEAEAVSIAFHFINAEFESPEMPVTFRIVTITGGVMRIIEQYYNVILDKETLEFMRFSNHVRNLVIEYLIGPKRKRAIKEDQELYDLLMTRERDIAECCGRIRLWLEEQHGLVIGKNDILFLAMHIIKILDGMEKK
ncbi:MAG: PRD domain-containing protein [Spirochaetaceae bacterium]|jgi:beta-glucoside operon transcriptional antiterminator|nr:PRD domain-containing protein [Spirochaetaceae bacterium]